MRARLLLGLLSGDSRGERRVAVRFPGGSTAGAGRGQAATRVRAEDYLPIRSHIRALCLVIDIAEKQGFRPHGYPKTIPKCSRATFSGCRCKGANEKANPSEDGHA